MGPGQRLRWKDHIDERKRQQNEKCMQLIRLSPKAEACVGTSDFGDIDKLYSQLSYTELQPGYRGLNFKEFEINYDE